VGFFCSNHDVSDHLSDFPLDHIAIVVQINDLWQHLGRLLAVDLLVHLLNPAPLELILLLLHLNIISSLQ